MADEDDREIGGQVVGALVGVVLATVLAVIDRLEESPEQLAFATVWAASQQAALHRLGDVALLACVFDRGLPFYRHQLSLRHFHLTPSEDMAR
jgi:hypothetical protein